MGYCPICNTSANLQQPNGGDYRRVDCRKCGKFQITGSALAMLPARLANNDKKSIARLSHATRLMSASSEAQWPEINSVNLDDMLRRPLPPIDRQLTNLLVWAAEQLGDDQLGTIELPDEEDLTAVIGTIDGGRVDDLISLAVSNGLVEFVPDHCIVVTPQGWARLQPTSMKEESQTSTVSNHSSVDRVCKAHCNKCRGLTNSWVRAEYALSGDNGPMSWSDSYEVLQCCGCEALSVRHKYWSSDWDRVDHDAHGQLVKHPGINETYYPAPTIRTKPTWSANLADEVLRNVLDELYSALDAGLSMLASVGARTLLDRAGYLLIGDPKGGFEGKLSELLSHGFISPHEKETLDAIADAGNASAHRGYTPTSERLGHIIDIMENFLHRTFVLTAAAKDIRTSTPARSPRKSGGRPSNDTLE